MRILAISDIHNNVACVSKLRVQEHNDFDVIVIAGDIGSYRAQEIFKILKTFKCPILYVYGNWDHRLARTMSFGKQCHLVHLNLIRIGSLTFTGFFYPSPRSQLTYTQHSRRCLSVLSKRLAAARIDPTRTVFISHERTGHLAAQLPNLLLHVYGHIHSFDVFRRGHTTYVNSSALDRIRAAVPKTLKTTRARLADMRHTNVGNYCVIELSQKGDMTVECRLLRRVHWNWALVTDPRWKNGIFGGALIPEEAIFGDNVRYPVTS
jgi:predicted phosphodiesterase